MCLNPEFYNREQLEKLIEQIREKLDGKLHESTSQIWQGRLEYLEDEPKEMANEGEEWREIY